MLIIGRKRDQKIIINDDIEITILEIGRNRVRFGVQAPKSVRIHTKLQHLPTESDSQDADAVVRDGSVERVTANADGTTTREITVPVAAAEGRRAANSSVNQSFAGAAGASVRRSR